MRDHKDDLNMVLSVGGWMMDSEAWSNVVRDKESMDTFTANAITFLRFHDFDGIDLDWQKKNSDGQPWSYSAIH